MSSRRVNQGPENTVTNLPLIYPVHPIFWEWNIRHVKSFNITILKRWNEQPASSMMVKWWNESFKRKSKQRHQLLNNNWLTKTFDLLNRKISSNLFAWTRKGSTIKCIITFDMRTKKSIAFQIIQGHIYVWKIKRFGYFTNLLLISPTQISEWTKREINWTIE